jgi:hypothetical protein
MGSNAAKHDTDVPRRRESAFVERDTGRQRNYILISAGRGCYNCVSTGRSARSLREGVAPARLGGLLQLPDFTLHRLEPLRESPSRSGEGQE